MVDGALFGTPAEPDLEVGAGAERMAGPGQHDGLDALVDVAQAKDSLELLGHLLREGVALVGAVQGDHHDGGGGCGARRRVRDLDMAEREGFVGGGDLDGGWREVHRGLSI